MCQVNCVTELLPQRALQRAAELDAYIVNHGKPVGCLHGLPISVKEHIGMDGLDCNAGFVGWIGRVAPGTALILRILWDAGCVFYARTTQPQTLMHLETSNNIYGVTVNPYNRKLTAGGSSGGEGALIGIRGSCLGIGTDIGGSIRSPAANNGIYGFKPTSVRLPEDCTAATMLNEEHILPAIGPLSASLEGIKLIMKTVLDAQPWLQMPSLVPIPWRMNQNWLPKDANGQSRLKIGVLWDDGVVKVHPPVKRALQDVVSRLKTIPGIEIVDWKPHNHDVAWSIIASLYFADGGAEDQAAIDLSGEPWRPLSKFIITDNPYVKSLTVADVWKWTGRREAYRKEYAALWNATSTHRDEHGHLAGMFDVILSPVGPGAAPPLDCARYWGYTSQWNLLDYPALAFPVTAVAPSVDTAEEGYVPRNEHDEYNHKLCEYLN